MTKPTRGQDQAADKLAEALLLVTEAARLDGKSPFGAEELKAVASALARASSAFDLDGIIARALERRGQMLGLRSGTSELLLLLDTGLSPLDTLRLTDAGFRARVDEVEKGLGEVD